jgi:hypothetical protein
VRWLIRQFDATVAVSVADEAVEASTTSEILGLLGDAIGGLVDVDLLPSELVAGG